MHVRHADALITTVRSWSSAHPRIGIVVFNALVALGCWGLAELALAPATAGRSITPMWPPTGLAVALVYVGGYRLFPGVAAGSFLVLVFRDPLPLALAIALLQVVQPLVDSRILRGWQFDARLERVRDVAILTLVAGPIGAFIEAALAVSFQDLAGVVPPGQFAYYFALWWLRDWLGVLIVTPLVFAWICGAAIKWSWRRAGEAAALVAVMLFTAQFAFGLWGVFADQNLPIIFVLFPLVGWASLRFGVRGATALVALLAALAIGIAGMSLGPFASFPVEFTQLLLFAFLSLASLTGLTLTAILAERDDAMAKRLLLEEQLRHSQKMEAVGRLAGGIAHDFNNLLTAIIGYAEIVLYGLDPKDDRRGDVEEIGRAAMRAADLTRQMLAFSRRQALQPRIIDLNQALTRMEPMLRRLLGEKIVMSVNARAAYPYVRVDAGQVEQVVMNLMVNASDAMPQGGRLVVETADVVVNDAAAASIPEADRGNYVMLSVADTGIGMTPEIQARIFEPYFTTKDVGKGTGLGLSTAYGIVRQSGGHIVVSSEVGLGTTFRIYLSRSDAPPDGASEPLTDRMPEGTEHILLVEDDASVRRLSKELLLRLGYSVTEAASGRAGLALGSDDARHFDLALCDVILGDMSGPAVAEALCALRPSIRVLYMSGYADEAIVRTGVLDEGKPFLQKPFTPRQLARKVREVLDVRDVVTM